MKLCGRFKHSMPFTGYFSTHSTFYQPAAHKAHGWLVLRLLCIFHICLYVYLFVCPHLSYAH